MSTSGGSSGGGGTFPLNGSDATYRYAETAAAGTLQASVDDGALGSLTGALALTANHGASSVTATLLAEGSAVNVGFTAEADDPGPSSATMLVDGKGLTIDANGNPVWSGTTPPAGILVATAHLNGAALAALFSAPTQIVAAPGANRALMVVGAFAEYVIGAAGTSHYDGGLGIGWLSGGALFLATGNWSSNPPTLLPQVTKVGSFPLPLGGSSGQVKANAVNKPLAVGDDTAFGTQVGPIVTATIAAVGDLYAPGDTGTIGPDPFTSAVDATYVVNTVSAGGHVTGFTVTAPGTGYETANNPQPTAVGGAQPGIGTGFTVDVTAIGAPGGDLYVTCLYTIVTTH